MNVALGIIIVLATVYFLVNRHDMRMVLMGSGLILAGIALDPLTVLDEFAKQMVTDSLIQAVCSAMGFAFVMQETRCMDHLTRVAAPGLRVLGLFLVPLATAVTFGINAALMSAANTAAAAGVILIPLMISAGIRPATAGAAVLAGTFGSMLNPDLSINTFVARLSGVSSVTVVEVQGMSVVVSLLAGAVCLPLTALLMKEKRNLEAEEGPEPAEPVNPLLALIPMVPTVVLVLGASNLVPPLQMGVAQAMVVGSLLGLVATRTSAPAITDRFFHGMGNAYGSIMGIIIAVAVFVRGMKAIGLVSFLISWLTTTPQIAKAGSALGPFLLGVITGSGDAAAFAFNEAVAPNADLYGMASVNMGTMAALAGALGRTMSPFAAAAIVCAAVAGVNPMDLARRNAPGMAAALLATYLII